MGITGECCTEVSTGGYDGEYYCANSTDDQANGRGNIRILFYIAYLIINVFRYSAIRRAAFATFRMLYLHFVGNSVIP